jgi:hypothetical protein
LKRTGLIALTASLLLTAAPALADDQEAAPAVGAAAQEAPPPAVTGLLAPAVYELPDPATLTRPELDFAATPEIEKDFEKYFYFHRDDTSFEAAFSDIRECDALSSGSNIYMGADSAAMGAAMAQYGALAGGVGGVIGSAIADAIFGSAARRAQRRLNMRNCMGFKGYQRYGLAGDLWKKFNFEEGNGRKKEDVRDEALELQALVASGPKPATKELGL